MKENMCPNCENETKNRNFCCLECYYEYMGVKREEEK